MTRQPMAPGGQVVERVVRAERCSGCGVCAGVCPRHALTMDYAPNGDLAPRLSGECAGEGCRLCLQVCPFADGLYDPRRLNEQVFGPPASPAAQPCYHPDTGWYRQGIAGSSAAHRPVAASGGLATLCLEQLLAAGHIDRAAVVGPAPAEKGVRFGFRAASCAQELRACAGSVYQPVEISGLLQAMLSGPELRWAAIGVPCLCAALRRAALRLPRLQRRLKFILGLACGMYQNRMYTELLTAMSGIPPAEACAVNYRLKGQGGAASNYGFCATARDGTRGKVLPYHGLPYFLGANAYFRCHACNACMDVFAEAADACFMDAWIPPYNADPRGTSLVLLREESLVSLLAAAADDSTVEIAPAGPDAFLAAQSTHIRRKRHLIGMRAGGATARASLWDRLQWWLQQRTQRRSKAAWARLGDKKRVWLFWLRMADLWLLQHGSALLLQAALRARGLWRRLGRGRS